VLGIAVADVGVVAGVLSVDHKGVVCCAAQGFSLEEGDVGEGWSNFPHYLQLFVLQYLALDRIFLGFLDAVGHIGT